ncbi:cation transporter [Paraburkholderia sediminicola]|uniref:Cation transporter n=1 Tax=Paraburkholderia rhynchosiae TaxID=487049 RepID=A0ACC7N9I9_9BURK
MQIALGITAQSDGLLADGVHTLSDVAADAIVLVVLCLSARHISVTASDARHTDHTIEQGLASLLIAAVLILTAVEMLWRSIDQSSPLSGGTAMHTGALAVSSFVMVAKEMLFRYLRAEGRRSGSAILMPAPAMRASMPCLHWSRPWVWPAVSRACRCSITSRARRSAC